MNSKTKIVRLKASKYQQPSPVNSLSIIMKNCQASCASANFYYLSETNRIEKEGFPTPLTEAACDAPQQFMQRFCPIEKAELSIRELTEYYKYYTQQSMLFMVNYHLMLRNYQQRKKIVEYKRLKALLSPSGEGSFSDSEQCVEKQAYKSPGNILSQLETTNPSKEESLLLFQLRKKLSKHIGHSKKMTIQQIDRLYEFPSRQTNSHKLGPLQSLKKPKPSLNYSLKKVRLSKAGKPAQTNNLRKTFQAKISPFSTPAYPMPKKNNNKSCENVLQLKGCLTNTSETNSPFSPSRCCNRLKGKPRKYCSMENVWLDIQKPNQSETAKAKTRIKCHVQPVNIFQPSDSQNIASIGKTSLGKSRLRSHIDELKTKIKGENERMKKGYRKLLMKSTESQIACKMRRG